MRVLIIGAGYVGMPLAVTLAERGHAVWGLRRRPALETAPPGVQFLQADITDPASLRGLPGGWDWVVNCAASTAGGPEDYRRTYLEGTRNLVGWLRARPPRNYVYTSSTGVYGQNDGSFVNEQSPTEPEPATSRILVETEAALLEAARGGFPAVILRVAGIYGPARGYWLRQFQAGEARLEGAGERWLNMVHRDDVVGSIIAALESGISGQVYNVADDEPVTQRTVFEWLAERLGKPLPPSVPPDPNASRKRGVTNKRISNERLRRDLGYRLRFPTFREGYAAELERR